MEHLLIWALSSQPRMSTVPRVATAPNAWRRSRRNVRDAGPMKVGRLSALFGRHVGPPGLRFALGRRNPSEPAHVPRTTLQLPHPYVQAATSRRRSPRPIASTPSASGSLSAPQFITRAREGLKSLRAFRNSRRSFALTAPAKLAMLARDAPAGGAEGVSSVGPQGIDEDVLNGLVVPVA